MISTQEIQEILRLYQKHGWTLRRILLTEKLRSLLTGAAAAETLFPNAEIEQADIDAAWFSRRSGNDREAWEIRHLSQTPYALVEVFEEEDDEEVRAERRHEIQEQLRERTTR